MSLHAACGLPTLRNRLPSGKSPAWAAARNALQKHLADAGCLYRIRSWQQLWGVLHSTAAPTHTTWSNLLQEFTFIHLLRILLTPGYASRIAITYWNARWLSDTLGNGAA